MRAGWTCRRRSRRSGCAAVPACGHAGKERAADPPSLVARAWMRLCGCGAWVDPWMRMRAEGVRVGRLGAERIIDSTLIYLGFLGGLLVGRNFRSPDGAPRVNFNIRPKTAVFRVSEPANPWVKTRNRNRKPRTRNPRIPAPNPIRCHLYPT